jgi:hypothetical protein
MGHGFAGGITIIHEEVKIDYLTKIDDAGGGITYIGKALPGTETSAASWQIQRIDETQDPDIEITFADGTNTFVNIWDDRAAYTYS